MFIRTSLLILITFWSAMAYSLGFPEKAIQLVPNEKDAFLMQSYAHPRKAFTQAIDALPSGGRLLLFAPIKPTFEDEIFEDLRREIHWKEALASYDVLSDEDYRQIVQEKGCTIHHVETQRGLASFEEFETFSEWIERDLARPLALNPSETRAFIDEAFFRFSQTEASQDGRLAFPYRRFLLLIEK